jgi:hypothetical protein
MVKEHLLLSLACLLRKVFFLMVLKITKVQSVEGIKTGKKEEKEERKQYTKQYLNTKQIVPKYYTGRYELVSARIT